MKVLMRTTANGNEYWCTEEKRTLFVPAGSLPDFEVTENPKSMVGGVDLATGPDATVINGEVKINLQEMNIKELREYAAELEIEVPADVKKKDDIIALLSDTE